MLVVDSSIWIDFFNGRAGPHTDALSELLQRGELSLVVPDLVLFEVLRGFRQEQDLRTARILMESFDIEPTSDAQSVQRAVDHYRGLRQRGYTPRSAVDVLVASFCIDHDYTLLHNDRDFEAFQRHLGLKVWPVAA